ncbi:MAG: pentapeptide repeat-containing protein [Deltaproteobacteria bacterium]|nr:pentapeptide repeat-containing protein [Deltaproteobacteria bacterium]
MSNCVQSKGHMWCKNLPSHYRDKEGKNYCIFHAPEGCKGDVAQDEFVGLLLRKISEDYKEGKSCNLSGTVFEWHINFKDFYGENVLHKICFSKSLFCRKADFSHVTFNGDALFSKAIFCEEADFEYARFQGSANFSGAVFHDKARFFDATVEGYADFSSVTFNKTSYFSWGAFKNKVIFKNTCYKENAIFKRPVF